MSWADDTITIKALAQDRWQVTVDGNQFTIEHNETESRFFVPGHHPSQGFLSYHIGNGHTQIQMVRGLTRHTKAGKPGAGRALQALFLHLHPQASIEGELVEHNLGKFAEILYHNPTVTGEDFRDVPAFGYTDWDYHLQIDGDEVFFTMKKAEIGKGKIYLPEEGITEPQRKLIRERIIESPPSHWGYKSGPKCKLSDLKDP